ncbi:MAG: peptide ABC transporter substrate-binding protein [Spirochaetales bacterium]|nr:peptide ABC transporter substrate-binding protein [Spirochaetales bacterium]
MRKMLLIVIAATMALPLFAMGNQDGGSRTVDRYDNTYQVEVKTLNYFLLLDTTAQRVAANTQDHLVEQDRFGRFIPSLAESWTPNADSTVWTFKLRKGQKWVDHTGTPTTYEITADDFVEGFRYVSDPANGIRNISSVRNVIKGLYDYYYTLVDIDGGKIQDKTREAALATFGTVGVKALDAYTVEYTLTQPTPFFLSYLIMDLFYPVEKAFLDAVGPANLGIAKENMLYSGGYYLSDWQRDKLIVMTRNEHNWDKDNITVRSINMQKVSDPTVELQMFMRGELSSALLSAEQAKALEGSPFQDKVYMTDLTSVTFWWHPNYQSPNPEFNAFIRNENFRKALYYGIDHEKFLSLDDQVNPKGLIRSTIIPEDQCFDEKGRDFTDYPGVKEFKDRGNPYNPAKAREYLAKAIAELTDGKGSIRGVTAGPVDMKPIADFSVDGKLPIQMVYVHTTSSKSTTEALLFQAMMKDTFGDDTINVVLGQFVDNAYREAILPLKYDMMWSSFRFAYADPMAQFGRLVTDGGFLNMAVDSSKKTNTLFDKTLYDLVQAAAAETVLSRRYAAFAKVEKHIQDKAYIMPYRAGGGSYTISRMVPYTVPRGGFGVTRFKYKGMIVESQPLTAARVAELRTAFFEEFNKLTAK